MARTVSSPTTYPSFRILPAEDRAYIVAKIEAGEVLTMKNLVEETGRDRNAVVAFCRQTLATLIVEGKAPQCACGKPLFHRGACGRRECNAVTGSLRETVIDMLLNAAVYDVIGAACGLTYNQVHHICRGLSPDQKSTRLGAFARASRRQAKARRSAVPAASGIRDDLYLRIKATMPRGVPPSLRDDIISEVYLAVLEQRLPADAIELEAKRFINAGYAAWASRYGARSQDECMSDDYVKSRVEMIPDPSALAAFDRIGFAREWA